MPKYKLYMGKKFIASTNFLEVAQEWTKARPNNRFVVTYS